MIVTRENYEQVGLEISCIDRAAFELLQEHWPEEADEQIIVEAVVMDNSYIFRLYHMEEGEGCSILLNYSLVEKRAKELLEKNFPRTIDTQNQ